MELIASIDLTYITCYTDLFKFYIEYYSLKSLTVGMVDNIGMMISNLLGSRTFKILVHITRMFRNEFDICYHQHIEILKKYRSFNHIIPKMIKIHDLVNEIEIYDFMGNFKSIRNILIQIRHKLNEYVKIYELATYDKLIIELKYIAENNIKNDTKNRLQHIKFYKSISDLQIDKITPIYNNNDSFINYMSDSLINNMNIKLVDIN